MTYTVCIIVYPIVYHYTIMGYAQLQNKRGVNFGFKLRTVLLLTDSESMHVHTSTFPV